MITEKERQILVNAGAHLELVRLKVSGSPCIAYPENFPDSHHLEASTGDAGVLYFFVATPSGFVFSHSKFCRTSCLSEIECLEPVPESEQHWLSGEEGKIEPVDKTRRL